MQFILQKSEKPSQSTVSKKEIKSVEQDNREKPVDGRKNLSSMENVGIVKGIPQKNQGQDPITEDLAGNAEATKERTSNSARTENLSSDHLLDLYNPGLTNNNPSPSPVTSIGAAGNLKPPAYRNPPAPKAPIHNQKLIDFSNVNFSPILAPNDAVMQNVQYRDLVQLIKYQRDKISTQQNDLTKVSFNCEIIFYAASRILNPLFSL